MIVTCRDAELVLPPSRYPRSPGIHQSSIIRAMAIEGGLLKAEWADEIELLDYRVVLDPIARSRMCIGLAWEEFYIPTQCPEVVDHPGETCLDGIYMTKDGESITVFFIATRKHARLVIHEVKATYKSINTVGLFDTQVRRAKNWMWIAQLLGYCKEAKTRYACLHVMFLCGDYKYPIRPVPKIFDIEFTDEELEDNWVLMTDYVKYRLGDDYMLNQLLLSQGV